MVLELIAVNQNDPVDPGLRDLVEAVTAGAAKTDDADGVAAKEIVERRQPCTGCIRVAVDQRQAVLGAGASAAQGLPTWNELLLRMLVGAAKQDGRFENDEARDGWARAVKLTPYLPGGSATLPTKPAVAPGEDDYSTNIQVADLNALNALFAVIEWKRWLGFYATHSPATEVVYKLYLNELRNGDAA